MVIAVVVAVVVAVGYTVFIPAFMAADSRYAFGSQTSMPPVFAALATSGGIGSPGRISTIRIVRTYFGRKWQIVFSFPATASYTECDSGNSVGPLLYHISHHKHVSHHHMQVITSVIG